LLVTEKIWFRSQKKQKQKNLEFKLCLLLGENWKLFSKRSIAFFVFKRVNQISVLFCFFFLREIYNELVKNSTSFEKIAPFPKMDHVKPVENDIRYFFNPQEVVNHAKKCRPVLLEKVVKQILKFLQYKVTFFFCWKLELLFFYSREI
jgi:hypothetical protein